MLALSRVGIVIAPPLPASCTRPSTVEDVLARIRARVLVQFGPRWEGPETATRRGNRPDSPRVGAGWKRCRPRREVSGGWIDDRSRSTTGRPRWRACRSAGKKRSKSAAARRQLHGQPGDRPLTEIGFSGCGRGRLTWSGVFGGWRARAPPPRLATGSAVYCAAPDSSADQERRDPVVSPERRCAR